MQHRNASNTGQTNKRGEHKMVENVNAIYTIRTTHRTDTEFHMTQPIRLSVFHNIAIMKRVTTIYTT